VWVRNSTRTNARAHTHTYTHTYTHTHTHTTHTHTYAHTHTTHTHIHSHYTHIHTHTHARTHTHTHHHHHTHTHTHTGRLGHCVWLDDANLDAVIASEVPVETALTCHRRHFGVPVESNVFSVFFPSRQVCAPASASQRAF
jgi:hypothetical protein